MVTDASERTPLASRVVRGTGLTAIGYLATQIAMLGSYVVLARLASPSTFGTFAAAAILVTTGSFLAESGMTAALVQRRRQIGEATATATISTFVGGALLAVGALVASPLIGLFFQSREIGEVSAALAGVFVFNAAAVVPSALLQRSFSLRPVLVVEPAAAAAMGIAGGVALWAGLGVWGLVVGAYASSAVRTSLMWAVARWLPAGAGASWAMWKELASFARHVVASEAVRHTSSIATIGLIGRVLGPAPLGQWGFGWRMALAGAGVTSAGAYILLPTFSQVAPDPVRLRDGYLRALRVASLCLFPLSLLLVAVGEPLAVTLFGAEWAEAGRVLMALAGVVLCAGIGSVTSEMLKAAGRPDVLMKTHTVNAVLSIAFVASLVAFGPVAVGIGLSVASGIAAVYAVVRGARIVGTSVRPAFALMAAPLAAASISATAVFLLDRLVFHAESHGTIGGIALIVLELALGGLLYVPLVTALSRPAAAELRSVRDLLASPSRG